MSRRRGLVAGVAVLGLLAGCGGGGDDEGDVSPSPDPTSQAPSPAPSESPSADPTADSTAYLPTPEGITLTAPGTALRFKDAALAAWKPRQDVVGVVGVRVLKVEQTTVAKSLVGFQLDAAARASTPYFVSTEVGNGGDTDLGGRQLPIYAVDSADRLIPPTGVDQGFKPCPGSVLPAIFAPGDEARSCLIFLVPSGATLQSVMFRPPEGVVPLTWTGKVKQLGAKPATRDKKKNQPASG